jgi:ABC-type transport system involved in Fe-S cluster assembly fused permease/ATPase subunit
MGLAAKDVVDGKISLGDLVAINAYIVQLYSPLSTKLLECLFPLFLA